MHRVIGKFLKKIIASIATTRNNYASLTTKRSKYRNEFKYKNRYESETKKLIWNTKYNFDNEDELKKDIRLQYQEVMGIIRHLSVKRLTLSSVFISINVYFIYKNYNVLLYFSPNKIILFLFLTAICLLWNSSVNSLNNQLIMFFADLDELQKYLPAKPFGNNMVNIRYLSGDREYMPHYNIEPWLSKSLLLFYLGEVVYNAIRLITHLFNLV